MSGDKHGAPVDVPAVGFSVTMNTGNDRQIVLQTHYARDMAESEVNALLDKMLRVADRQRARYEIGDLRAELLKHETTLQQFDEDFSRIEHDFKVAQAKRDVAIGEFQRLKEDTNAAGYNEFISSGRRGAYEPKGLQRANLQRMEAEIRRVEEEKNKAAAERDQALGNIGISRKRYIEAIVTLQGKIAEREKIIGG